MSEEECEKIGVVHRSGNSAVSSTVSETVQCSATSGRQHGEVLVDARTLETPVFTQESTYTVQFTPDRPHKQQPSGIALTEQKSETDLETAVHCKSETELRVERVQRFLVNQQHQQMEPTTDQPQSGLSRSWSTTSVEEQNRNFISVRNVDAESGTVDERSVTVPSPANSQQQISSTAPSDRSQRERHRHPRVTADDKVLLYGRQERVATNRQRRPEGVGKHSVETANPPSYDFKTTSNATTDSSQIKHQHSRPRRRHIRSPRGSSGTTTAVSDNTAVESASIATATAPDEVTAISINESASKCNQQSNIWSATTSSDMVESASITTATTTDEVTAVPTNESVSNYNQQSNIWRATASSDKVESASITTAKTPDEVTAVPINESVSERSQQSDAWRAIGSSDESEPPRVRFESESPPVMASNTSSEEQQTTRNGRSSSSWFSDTSTLVESNESCNQPGSVIIASDGKQLDENTVSKTQSATKTTSTQPNSEQQRHVDSHSTDKTDYYLSDADYHKVRLRIDLALGVRRREAPDCMPPLETTLQRVQFCPLADGESVLSDEERHQLRSAIQGVGAELIDDVALQLALRLRTTTDDYDQPITAYLTQLQLMKRIGRMPTTDSDTFNIVSVDDYGRIKLHQ